MRSSRLLRTWHSHQLTTNCHLLQKDTKFITACKPLQRWGIINFDRRPVDGFVQALADQAAQRGKAP